MWSDGTHTVHAELAPATVLYVYNKESNDRFQARDASIYTLEAGDLDYLPQFDGTDGNGHVYPAGNDANSGLDPDHALQTLREAYKRLSSTNNTSRNKIVVMGYAYDPYDIQTKGSYVYPYLSMGNRLDPQWMKAATISGKHNNINYGGIINIAYPDYATSISCVNLALPAPTIFEDVVLFAENRYNTHSQDMQLHCYMNDLTIGENVIFANFTRINATNMGLDKNVKSPAVTIAAGTFNNEDPGFITYSPLNAMPRLVQITIKSAGIARIIGASRNNSKPSDITYNICGTAEVPLRTRIDINIPANLGVKGELAPEYYKRKEYSHDIGLVVGGQTDGSVYADVAVNYYDGYLSRFASGNISYSRHVDDHPDDSFFGKTVLNAYGGQIDELFGGSIGRHGSDAAGMAERTTAYFYGHSILNIYDTTINNNIYGAGSGGVTGMGVRRLNLQDIPEVTADEFIPYIDNISGKLHYGPYETVMAHGTLPQMKDYDGNVIDLFETRTEVNIYSGHINGNVYGGGYGYSNNTKVNRAPVATTLSGRVVGISGNLYGSTHVTIKQLPGYRPPQINGSVYGAGSGASNYHAEAVKELAKGNDYGDFSKLALTFGTSNVNILGGVIHGNVYAGAKGVVTADDFLPDMATIYGATSLTIANDTITDPTTGIQQVFIPEIKGHVFGGSALANISRLYPKDWAQPGDGGTEVKIYGGIIGDCIFGGSEGEDDQDFYSHIEGDTRVLIDGRPTISTDLTSIHGQEKRFNIYGGGYYSCDVKGDAYVTMHSTPLVLKPGFDFLSHWRDVTYRRFCVYGGGFGEATTVRGSTYVTIDIPTTGTTPVRDGSPTEMIERQMMFDVVGGGYNGNVGYWADVNGLCRHDEGYISTGPGSFDKYMGGSTNVTIRGNAFVRKVTGGGFYASSPSAHTRLISGSIETVTGGSLLGYVHKQAKLDIGSDDADQNQRLFIHGDVFGGNDVKGIVGTELYIDPITGERSYDLDDGEPLYQANLHDTEDEGVVLNISGGTIGGNVYGAGNGHYRGYYVPEWVEYKDGNKRCYRTVESQFAPSGQGLVYRSRPMTGCVNMNIRGNSATDRITIRGSVYGGGKAATIGQWDTKLLFNDPRRYMRGGFLHVNIGSHVTIDGDLFMGVQGRIHGNQTRVPAGFNLDQEITTSERLDQLGDAAYDHWYWDSDAKKYRLGYAPPGKNFKDLNGNDHLAGEHQLRGFLKHIEMNGTVELTFYNDLYDDEGNRRRWLPSEETVGVYDAEDVIVSSFYLGGECGSMTNNILSPLEYADGQFEQVPAIYRVSLPSGITIKNRVSLGSYNSGIKYHPYTDNTYTDFNEDVTMYTFNGGIVPQTSFSYEYICFADWYNTKKGYNYELDNYYSGTSRPNAATNPELAAMWEEFIEELKNNGNEGERYVLTFGPDAGKEIHRKLFLSRDQRATISPEEAKVGGVLTGLAMQWITTDQGPAEAPYVGMREHRVGNTAVKGGINCKFKTDNPDGNLATSYGANIFGGCYQSGHTNGDIVINVISDMLDENFDDLTNEEIYQYSGIGYNFGRIYGGGYGANTLVRGSTYINLIADVHAMNVFGGGHEGAVTGSSNISYFGSETSMIHGAIYGGGMRGIVGSYVEDPATGVRTYPVVSTNINLYSGNVDKVYGGGCVADTYGGTSVNLYDEVRTDLNHIDYERVKMLPGFDQLPRERLIVGAVYGGNDISGVIYTNPGDLCTHVNVHEVQGSQAPPQPSPASEGEGEKSDTPGSDGNGYNGFPLVGSLYGGGNGNYGNYNPDTGRYTTGTVVRIASGVGADYYEIDLGDFNSLIPNIDNALIEISGGTIVSAYGGGNRATVKEKTTIKVDYDAENNEARAGFFTADEANRIWRLLHLTGDEQMQEVLETNPSEEFTAKYGNEAFAYKYQIYRLFGGNNRADMAIQPTWELNKAYIGSIYSGGNFGSMTYYNPDADPTATQPEKRYKGLQLTISSDQLHAENVYGGGRVGNIDPTIVDPNDPTIKTRPHMTGDDYGATVNINGGVITNVYGGNDVAGFVFNGTNVNISGAISGNVYCAGNGNHRYLYDPLFEGSIEEHYDYQSPTTGESVPGRYFRLPRRNIYGGSAPLDEERLLAINSYRPNIDRAYLNIFGTEERQVFVHGAVFCGGNSSTVVPIDDKLENGMSNGDVRFNIGNYVTLNKVFLGSNGEYLTDIAMIEDTERLNGFKLTDNNDLTDTRVAGYADDLFSVNDISASNKELYPSRLDLYMRAVEVMAEPRNFRIRKNLTLARIGEFYVGGNRGSIVTNEPISLVFPETLTIFGHICGGSRNANVNLRGVTSIGGLKNKLDPEKYGKDDYKVHLQVKSNFEPWRIHYPVEGDIHRIQLVPNLVEDAETGKTYFANGACNVYGGCYESGITAGNIRIDLFSDMMREYPEDTRIGTALAAKGITSKKETVLDGINDKHWRPFNVIGGGYGSNTTVNGDIRIDVLPAKASASYAYTGLFLGDRIPKHPSAAGIFAGSQEGLVVGNTYIYMRDGTVFTNLYGASEAARLYGSTSVMIGWPKYYVCNTKGEYQLDRADNISHGATMLDDDGRPVIKRSIKYMAGDIVSQAMYDRILDPAKDSKFNFVEDDMPYNYSRHDDTYIDSNGDVKPLSSSHFNWDDIEIHIGDPNSRTDRSHTYYGHGDVYGGGYIPPSASVTLAGENTVCFYNSRYNNNPEDIGYGGNTSIIVHDNFVNADLTKRVNQPDGIDGEKIAGHVTIGTSIYRPVKIKEGQDVMGKYIYDSETGRYIHQSSHKATAAEAATPNLYFEVESDGGIYGGGRQVFVDGFSACDIAYYGYATYSPQFPKLLNTFQRLDLLSVTDCCLQLQGANDLTAKSMAENYAITRIGELRMNSSIHQYADHQDLNPGHRGGAPLYNIEHEGQRSRNYIAFFSSVHYLGAIVSNTSFTDDFRGANGERFYEGDFHDVDEGDENASDTNLGLSFSYKQYKQARINDYYAARQLYEQDSEEMVHAQLRFDQRNIGTAANMIGINNGFTLNVQGVAGRDDDGSDKTYYGPIDGVVEIKLLTLAQNEGGGYVYAFNHHEDPENFLESTGNFVFPGAAYQVSNDERRNYNYIYDDCYPMGVGFDNLNSPEDEERHYWYVNGSHFFYDVTLTAYTYNRPIDFTLDSNEHLIYLYGISPGSNFKIEEVTWEASENTDSDLLNHYKHGTPEPSHSDYRLYLSVDQNASGRHTLDPATETNSFVTRVPWSDYILTDPATQPADINVAYPDSLLNNYGHTGNNTPLLGVTLRDFVDNSAKDYYEQRLKEPERVFVTLKGTTPPDEGGAVAEFTYTLRLTIHYLLGPIINGNPEIENCALPGEYIFANSKGITVEMDNTAMAITSRNWYLVPPDVDVSDYDRIDQTRISIDDEKFTNTLGDVIDERQIHIPAYYFLNDWQLVYALKANSHDFYVSPLATSTYPRLHVHNYHRSCAWDGSTMAENPTTHVMEPKTEVLKIIPGARVYIEDDRDLEYFLRHLKEAQDPAHQETLFSGQTAHPQYGEDVEVYLMADVAMPQASVVGDLSTVISKYIFKGNGHTIDLKDNLCFIGDNQGWISDVGFVSASNSDQLRVIDTNSGSLVNAYFYNTASTTKGRLVGTEGGTVTNCYQNTPSGASTNIVGNASEGFEYGSVAYNLNSHYLEHRMGETVDAVERIFNDGEYRFAVAGNTAEAQRTAPRPNYRDYLGIRQYLYTSSEAIGSVTGANATMHNTEHLVDSRWSEEDGMYRPTTDDHIFFGQDLSASGNLPRGIFDSKRVYRASGFYGSLTDLGYHFNADVATVRKPDITAIDFTGRRDLSRPMARGTVSYAQSGKTMQRAFYPPMLDMPTDMIGGVATTVLPQTLNIVGNPNIDEADAVTKNLLIYTDENYGSTTDMLHYTTTDDENTIVGHHLVLADDGSFEAADGLLHLVDKQDFNAPIAFNASVRAWYDRLPVDFSSGNSAWEGICLPFTPHRVVATEYNQETIGQMNDHGELTHFYGDDEILHEYWLRGLTGRDAQDETILTFTRPKLTSTTGTDKFYPSNLLDQNSQPITMFADNYHYSNTWFMDVYGNRDYISQHNQYTPEGRDFERYTFLTEGVPYIVSFPGLRYYEFDMSGEFFKGKFGGNANKQLVTYETLGSVTFPVSDIRGSSTTMGDGYLHQGTYLHRTLQSNEYTITEDYDSDDNLLGTKFTRSDMAGQVKPFRTYVTAPTSRARTLTIGEGLNDPIGPDQGEGDEQQELPTPGSELTFSVEANHLVIDAPAPGTIMIHDTLGRLMRSIDVVKGRTVVDSLTRGIYIASPRTGKHKAFKFNIR